MRGCITLVAVCTLVGLVSAAPPDGCESWAMHGYRVGMSLEKAQQLRKTKERDGYWHVKVQGEFQGVLQFTKSGLEYFQASLGGIVVKDDWPVDVVVDVEAVRNKLVQRLGPVDKKLRAERPGPQGRLIEFHTEVWTDEDCDTLVILSENFRDGGKGPVRFGVEIMLRRLSTLPEAQQEILDKFVPAQRK